MLKIMGLAIALATTTPSADVVATQIEERVRLPPDRKGVIEAHACINWIENGRRWRKCQKQIRFDSPKNPGASTTVLRTWGSDGKSELILPVS